MKANSARKPNDSECQLDDVDGDDDRRLKKRTSASWSVLMVTGGTLLPQYLANGLGVPL